MIGDSNQASLATVRLALLLSCPVYSGEKEKANRAYCSSTSWPNSIFPNSSMELRVPKICQKYKADQDTILGKTQIRPHHSIVKQTSSLSFFSTNTLFTLFFSSCWTDQRISNLRHLSVGEKIFGKKIICSDSGYRKKSFVRVWTESGRHFGETPTMRLLWIGRIVTNEQWILGTFLQRRIQDIFWIKPANVQL